MSFLEKIGFIETAEQERARLARAPEGSRAHALSLLPVNVTGWIQDLVIELPWAEMGLYDEPNRVIVVPFQHNPESRVTNEVENDTSEEESDAHPPAPRRRHSGWWDCIVVASTNPSYPVAGYRLSIPECELVRGKPVDIFALQQQSAS